MTDLHPKFYQKFWPFSRIHHLTVEKELLQADVCRWKEAAILLEPYAPAPTCKHCGGTNLEPDPAGYYCDAKDWSGRELLCKDCPF